ncbi:MAG TPA: hypothetical protein VHM24_02655 [Gemmatimonadaceae bacterium]|nr:hypothetical protein [Gemmatimonadaceae bacterium]
MNTRRFMALRFTIEQCRSVSEVPRVLVAMFEAELDPIEFRDLYHLLEAKRHTLPSVAEVEDRRHSA